MQPAVLFTLHALNLLVGILCIAILGLTTYSIILNDRVSVPEDVEGTSMGMLMWPGAGGVVDMLLFLGILIAGEKRRFVSLHPVRCSEDKNNVV